LDVRTPNTGVASPVLPGQGNMLHTATFNNNAGFGVAIGGVSNTLGDPTWGSIQSFQIGGVPNSILVLNLGGSRVGVGVGATAVTQTLGVAGSIGISRGNTGEYKRGFGSDSRWYPVYAPG
jgi:hypothetical protein